MPMFRPKIDRRPKVRCGRCWRFVGIDEKAVACPYCGGPLSSRLVDVPHLCRENRRAHEAVNRVWAWAGTFWLFAALLGWAFMKYQHNHLVDAVYYLTLALIPLWTARHVHVRVRPRFPSVYANVLFSPGIPEDPPAESADHSGH